jgi:hypothetical protein
MALPMYSGGADDQAHHTLYRSGDDEAGQPATLAAVV